MTTELENNINRVCHAYFVDRDRRLTTWENGFLADLCVRSNRYGNRIKLSDKQIAIINRIAEKVL